MEQMQFKAGNTQQTYKEKRQSNKLLNQTRYILESVINDESKYSSHFYLAKTIYFSDLSHLKGYARLISAGKYDDLNEWGWKYINRKSGAYPSRLKALLEDHYNFKIVDGKVFTLRACNKDFLSISEREHLDKVITNIKKYTVKEIIRQSFYEDIPINSMITIEELIRAIPDSDDLWNYYFNYD